MEFVNHPLCNIVYNPAEGTEHFVAPLPVVQQVLDDGSILLSSMWKPSASELEFMNAGGLVMLNVFGSSHPPVSIAVVDPSII